MKSPMTHCARGHLKNEINVKARNRGNRVSLACVTCMALGNALIRRANKEGGSKSAKCLNTMSVSDQITLIEEWGAEKHLWVVDVVLRPMQELGLEPFAAKFLSRVTVDPDTGCWIWGGLMLWNGYGSCYDPTRKVSDSAHRIAYIHMAGPIPEGFWLDHLCRVTACVNPEHLEVVTPHENIRRSSTRGALIARGEMLFCIRGHLLEGNRSETYSQGYLTRSCLTCKCLMLSLKKRERALRGRRTRIRTRELDEMTPEEQVELLWEWGPKKSTVHDLADCIHRVRYAWVKPEDQESANPNNATVSS